MNTVNSTNVITATTTIHAITLPTPFPIGPVNTWLLLGDEPTLVDAGPNTDEAWQALVAGLAAHGLAPRDLRHLFLTHTHADHYGNARRLAEAAPEMAIHATDLAQARPMLADEDAEWDRQVHFTELAMRLSGAPPEVLAQVGPRLRYFRPFGCAVSVTHWHQPSDWLRLGDGTAWQVVALPGHSMTQAGLWQPERTQMIAADHLLPRVSSNALLEPPAPGEKRRQRALPRYIESLRWTASLPPQQIYPGHGQAFHGQHALIEQRLAAIEERAARLLEALGAGKQTVIEMVQVIFPKLRPDQLFLAVSEVVGHLDVLEARGLVAFEDAEVRRYRL